jgi:hypothetical protein
MKMKDDDGRKKLRAPILSPNVDDMILLTPKRGRIQFTHMKYLVRCQLKNMTKGIDALIDNVAIREELIITSAHTSTYKSGN